MEETNFYRERVLSTDTGASCDKETEEVSLATQGATIKPTHYEQKPGDLHTSMVGQNNTTSRVKSYPQKLKIYDSMSLQYPNRLPQMALRPLIFLSFPVILYAGFSYGSNLVWFNVLNGTASLILSAKPYGFSTSMVGLAYFSPLLGAVLG